MSAARPEEIWSVLERLRAGASISEVAKQSGRSNGALKSWLRKYDGYNSLEELQLLLTPDDTRYVQIMERLFDNHWDGRSDGFVWNREELKSIAGELGIEPPKNLGDNIYAIRSGREYLPQKIRNRAPDGSAWVLLPNGKSCYRFVLAARAFLDYDPARRPIKIPDSTPQIVAKNAKTDEQAVLARIRYCRLVDIFMGLASFQLQSHMRTTIAHFNGAQTELDEIYVGVNGSGAQFVIPIQAKSVGERIGAIQVITDQFTCIEKFSGMIVRTLAAQTVATEEIEGVGQIYTIALIEAVADAAYNVTKVKEEHFQLVPAGMISEAELRDYRGRFEQSCRT